MQSDREDGGRGDARFDSRVAPFRRRLEAHCYRMLGDARDAEDALQETLLRAWRHEAQLAAESDRQAWLYAIATRVCLDRLRREQRRMHLREHRPGVNDDGPWLTPFRSDAIDDVGAPDGDPHAAAQTRENLALAFVAAVQHLAPRPRAILLLHDVVGWSARETAERLGGSETAVHSALQRARERVAKSWGGEPAVDPATESVVRRYLAAWESNDWSALAAELCDDVLLSMPPSPEFARGRDAVLALQADLRSRSGRVLELRPLELNGQLAFSTFVPEGPAGPARTSGVVVPIVRDGRIAEFLGHLDADLVAFLVDPR